MEEVPEYSSEKSCNSASHKTPVKKNSIDELNVTQPNNNSPLGIQASRDGINANEKFSGGQKTEFSKEENLMITQSVSKVDTWLDAHIDIAHIQPGLRI